MKRKYRVLDIDAIGESFHEDGEEVVSWSWNNWFNINTYHESEYGELSLIKNPNETYSFVGSVPCKLGFVTKAGNMVTYEEVQNQLMLPGNCRTIKTRVFQSEDEAWREAARLGYVNRGAE